MGGCQVDKGDEILEQGLFVKADMKDKNKQDVIQLGLMKSLPFLTVSTYAYSYQFDEVNLERGHD